MPMPRLPLLLVPLLAGCTDSLGLGSNCRSAMTAVRQAEGGPADLVQGPEELQGEFTEVWLYFDEGADTGRRYAFRWGVSIPTCQLEGPAPVSRTVLKAGGPTIQ